MLYVCLCVRVSLCDQSAEGTVNTAGDLRKPRLCFICELVSSSEVRLYLAGVHLKHREYNKCWWRLFGCKVTVCTRPRANILPCHRSRASRRDCDPASAPGSAPAPWKAPAASREPLHTRRSPETLMRTARVFGRRRGVFGANAGDCLFACVFSLNSGINIYGVEKQNRVLCLCSLPAPLPDDVLCSCVTERAP